MVIYIKTIIKNIFIKIDDVKKIKLIILYYFFNFEFYSFSIFFDSHINYFVYNINAN